MIGFEKSPLYQQKPDVEQLMEYRDLMADIVRKQGRGIRYARQGERASTRLGTEYMLPGAMTDWSIPDRKLRTHVERERRYSASFRPMGERAGRLLVLESDSVLIDPKTYGTQRNIYRFSWGEDVGVYEAEVLPIEIISSVQTDGEVLHVEPYGIKDIIALDHEHTAEATADAGGTYQRFFNPFRETESPWSPVSQVEFDGLLYRTDEFGRDLLIDAETA